MLQPTLWRTCRVLANRTRLEMFQLLSKQPDQSVSSLAERLNLTLPVASQYLRALEARGLLTARRSGLRVKYRPNTAASRTTVPTLAATLRLALQHKSNPVETIFKLATAFTHPRRVEVFRLLKARPRTLEQLRTDTDMSTRALVRHLRKLETRGFVVCQSAIYSVVNRRDVFGRELARLALV